MALVKESVKSLRIFLLLLGAFYTLWSQSPAKAWDSSLIERVVAILGGALGVALIYTGATLPDKLPTQIELVKKVLWAFIGFNCLTLIVSALSALLSDGLFNVFPVLGMLLGWYLLGSAQRLHDELASGKK